MSVAASFFLGKLDQCLKLSPTTSTSFKQYVTLAGERPVQDGQVQPCSP